MANGVMTDDSISLQAPARVQAAVRNQIEMMCKSLDQLLPPDHFARVVVALVKKLDLSEFYADIKAREGHVGRSPVDPAILIALIVLATVEGIGSDRQLHAAFGLSMTCPTEVGERGGVVARPGSGPTEIGRAHV